MYTEELSQNIEKSIARLSTQQQQKLLDFIKSILVDPKIEKSNIQTAKFMEYAGSWKDLDDEALKEFTNDLIARREKNTRRYEE